MTKQEAIAKINALVKVQDERAALNLSPSECRQYYHCMYYISNLFSSFPAVASICISDFVERDALALSVSPFLTSLP